MVLGIDDILKENLYLCAEEIRANIDTAGLRASGRTQDSIRVEVTDGTGTIYGRRAFGTLENGRRPGKVPVAFVDIIKQWIIDKRLHVDPIPYVRRATVKWSPKYTPEQRGLNAAAGAIAYKIRMQGTSLYRQGGRHDVYTPPIDACIKRVARQMAGLYKETILNDIRETRK